MLIYDGQSFTICQILGIQIDFYAERRRWAINQIGGCPVTQVLVVDVGLVKQ